MLTITNGAAEAIKQIVTTSKVGDDGGIRLSVQPLDGDRAKLELAIAPSPTPGDSHIEEAGANVFVDEKAAPFLQDKLLDATIESDGPSFSILEQQQG